MFCSLTRGKRRQRGEAGRSRAKASGEGQAKTAVVKLKRMWASEDVRIKYNEESAAREEADSISNKQACSNEKKGRISVFSAVPLKEEVDDKACINRNRDELIEAFCNFRTEFEVKVLKQQGLKNGTHYWPNICCKEWKDKSGGPGKKEDPCKRPDIMREKIVPFAMAQNETTYVRCHLWRSE